jgi:hypothetical protein
METLHVILIECDNINSLGGSCLRDIYNIHRLLISKNTIPSNIYILTNNTTFFTKKNMINIFGNSSNNFENIINKLNNITSLYIHISGHGYQGKDVNNIELDGRCEQIVLSSGVFRDIDFNKLLVKYIPKNTKLRISVDTCHSGSFSNFSYQIINETKKITETKKNGYFTNAYSISACKDSQLDACDIGEYGGFGGGLTTHILDNNNLIEFLLGDPLKVKNNLIPILKLLNQEPVLLVDNL